MEQIYELKFKGKTIYIGRTKISLKRRLENHFKTGKKTKIKEFLKDKKGSIEIVLIKKLYNKTGLEASFIEGVIIREKIKQGCKLLNSHINKGRTTIIAYRIPLRWKNDLVPLLKKLVEDYYKKIL